MLELRRLLSLKYEASVLPQLVGLLVAFGGCLISYPFAPENSGAPILFTTIVFGILVAVTIADVITPDPSWTIPQEYGQWKRAWFLLKFKPSTPYPLYVLVMATGITSCFSGDSDFGKKAVFWVCLAIILLTALLLIGQSWYFTQNPQLPPTPSEVQRDLYDILEKIKETSDDDLKAAYRRLSLKYHPGRNPNDTRAQGELAKVRAAFTVLCDSKKRKEYDEKCEVKGRYFFGITSLLPAVRRLGAFARTLAFFPVPIMPDYATEEAKEIVRHAGYQGDVRSLNAYRSIKMVLNGQSTSHTQFNSMDADRKNGLMLSISWEPSQGSVMVMAQDEQIAVQIGGRTTLPTFAKTPIVFLPQHGAYAFGDGDAIIPPLIDELGCDLMVLRPALLPGPHLLTIANNSEYSKVITIDIIRMDAHRTNLMARMKDAQKIICETQKEIGEKHEKLEESLTETEKIRTDLSEHEQLLLQLIVHFESLMKEFTGVQPPRP